jgi:endonuclease G
MASQNSSTRFRKLVEETRDFRADVRWKVEHKQWQLAEPNRERFSAYVARRALGTTARGAEAVQGETIDFQPAWFLPDGAQARRAVAYVEVTAGARSSRGSGFLISPSLFITNQHVLADENAARGAQIVFDRENGEGGRPNPTTSFLLDPDRFALFSEEEELDYAVVAVGERISGSGNLADFNFCFLSDRGDKHVLGMAVNIIQHPQGLPKMIAVRNNILQARTDRTLLYETDTDHGSSGAPVFNDDWEVVALHHYGEPFLERTDESGRPIPTNVNEGVRISAIYQDLTQKLGTLPGPAQELLREALAYGKLAPKSGGGKVLGPPRSSRESAAPATAFSHASGTTSPANLIPGSTPAMSQNDQGLRVTIPVEIIVRVGSPGASLAQTAIAAPIPAPKSLVRAAEKLQVDDDYSNRKGYDPDFIAGLHLPLPQPDAKLAKHIAALRASEPNATEGELKYEHFSVKINKAKRVAIFTATNIDGTTYLDVDRKTGRVSPGAEAETWFIDPRVSESFVLGQDFYSAWSTYFDRGHLTRRTDPTWGSADEAERANADTFHFTNCSPQHFRFNQSAKFWQGIERYVLENGVLDTDPRRRLSVFQGPIYNDSVDRWADDVQIPSSFFKIVVWKGQDGVKSIGMVVDQLTLLDEARKSLGAPKDLPVVNVQHWRVSVETIERRTGLSFPQAVRDADTFGQGAQPRVGEAAVPIGAFTDIPLR